MPRNPQKTPGPPDARALDRRINYLVDTYANLVLRLATMRLGSSFDAQDVCQHVFLRLVERARTANDFHDSQHEKAWVIRTTLNAITDLQRNAWNTKVEPLDDDATHEAIDPIDAGANEPLSDRDVLDAVNALTPAYREAVYLYYYEGYTSRQIAELTGTTPDAVNTRLSRARAKLRGILEGEAS